MYLHATIICVSKKPYVYKHLQVIYEHLYSCLKPKINLSLI